ncbi:c-type cytochrome domain-containing protein [Anatilimnocola sp. NA78]|uniref:c-type cytochrome domain-containing protein n=1 Tax=Anatilimnocola sp. NA78 TaxID=3415683 RepID=UPI003CE54EAC
MFARHKPTFLSFVAAVTLVAGVFDGQLRGAEKVDFEREVRPILEQHCWKCHGQRQAGGGLRLDEKLLGERGGGSGKNAFAGPPQHNELLRRVRSTKDGERMPLEGPPLTAEQIGTLDQWIAQGADWPLPSPMKASSPYLPASRPLSERLLDRWEQFAAPHFHPAYYLAIGLLTVVLVIERSKESLRKSQAREANGSDNSVRTSFARHLAPISRVWYCVGLLAVALYVTTIYWQAEVAELRRNLQGIHQTGDRPAPLALTSSASRLHEPLRPQHPPRLGGIYYRGNDERSPELFNGGYYRTATFSIHLADAEGNRLGWDDSLPEQVFLRFEIVRSPFSSPTLFSQDIMEGVALSPIQPEQLETAAAVPLLKLTTIEKGERWSVLYPLDHIPDEGRLAGKLYLYRSSNADGRQPLSEPSYLIGYELAANEGLVSRESQIWMASVYNVAAVQWPDEGKIQASEWFDFRPIPEIER